MLDCEMQQLFEQSLDELEKKFVEKLASAAENNGGKRMRIIKIDL